jgi:hypothetical protein
MTWSGKANTSRKRGDRARFDDPDLDELFRTALTTGEWTGGQYLDVAEDLRLRGSDELVRLQDRLIDELASLRFHVPEPPSFSLARAIREIRDAVEERPADPDPAYDWLWPYLDDVRELGRSQGH